MKNKEELLDRITDVIFFARTAKEDLNEKNDEQSAIIRLKAAKDSLEATINELENR